MSRVYEQRSGAQLLPDVGDPRATLTAWSAHCCTDADLRRRSEAHANVASRLLVVP